MVRSESSKPPEVLFLCQKKTLSYACDLCKFTSQGFAALARHRDLHAERRSVPPPTILPESWSYLTPGIQGWVARVTQQFCPKPGRVLEVGSLDVNGGVRGSFAAATQYIGIDQEAGEGVDTVLDAHEILAWYGDKVFDTIVCCEMLEHDREPWITIRNMQEALRVGGLLIVSSPIYTFGVHRFPKDYWRLGEDTYRDLVFEGFEILDLSEVPSSWCGIGRKL